MKGCCAAELVRIAQAINERIETERNPDVQRGLLIAKNIVKNKAK